MWGELHTCDYIYASTGCYIPAAGTAEFCEWRWNRITIFLSWWFYGCMVYRYGNDSGTGWISDQQNKFFIEPELVSIYFLYRRRPQWDILLFERQKEWQYYRCSHNLQSENRSGKSDRSADGIPDRRGTCCMERFCAVWKRRNCCQTYSKRYHVRSERIILSV